MTGRWHAFVRLLAVQGAWNYERMLGVGVGYASEPLMKSLREADPQRGTEATSRAAMFFNCHPYLAGVAVGATAASEQAGEPGEKILRLRTALSGTLGALGDQLFWVGLLPALMALALIVTAAGAPWWGVGLFLVGYNASRVAVSWWGLRIGLHHGPGVGRAIAASVLRRASGWAGVAAGLLVGIALPIVGRSLTSGMGSVEGASVLLLAGLGLGVALLSGRAFSGIRYGLALVVLVMLWHGIFT